MEKYETNFEGYVPLKYVDETDAIVDSTLYRINLEKMKIINVRNKILAFQCTAAGYQHVGLGKKGQAYIHRIVWEHVKGKIPDGKEIDHIDNNRTNNKIDNLQLLTHQENSLKGAKNRDYSFIEDSRKNAHIVKVTDTVTGETEILPSLYAAAMFCGINSGTIKMCCDKVNYCKSGISKTTITNTHLNTLTKNLQ